jgi:heptosyltransferase III
LLSAVIADMRRHFPQAQIALFCSRSNREVAPFLGKGLSLFVLNVTSPFKSLSLIREKEWDWWIDCNSWPRLNALLTFFARAHFKIGFQTKRQYRHGLYDLSILHSHQKHELENFRQLLRALGIPTLSLPSLSLPEAEEKNRSKQIVLHCFSSGAKASLKTWPLNHWIKLIEGLLHNRWEVVLTGNQLQRSFFPSSFFQKKGLLVQAGDLSLLETARVLQASQAVVTIDTGIMHLSAALKCLTFCLHGPTSPQRWGAIGPHVRVFTPSFSYKPCLSLGFESTCFHNFCMERLSAEEVLQSILFLSESLVK